MQRIVPTRSTRTGVLLALMLWLGAGSASAQCTISGPASLCGGTAELCGPAGPYFYEWTDANGAPLGDQRCLTVTAPGEYRLTTFDFINGLSAGPCIHVLAPGGSQTSCTVTGSGSACEGTLAELCGPEGVLEYLWSGPDGFSASTRCVEVGAAGNYQVQVRNDPTGCWSAPCERAVAFEPCGSRGNCPIAPWLWVRQCGSRRFDRGRLFDAKQMADIGAWVDAHAAAFAWKHSGEGLCRTLNSRHSLRDRARRQFASVVANTAVHELGLDPMVGTARGLAPETMLHVDGFSGTVAEWISRTDARLGDLDRRHSRQRQVKDGYRAIIRAGWQINHGLGMGAVCGTQPMASHESSFGLGETSDETAIDDETLEIELRDPEQSLSFESLEPNPTRGPARISYVVSSSASGEVFVGVFDLAGRLVRELERGERAPGRYLAVWDGRDGSGHAVGNGAYFVVGRIGAERTEGRLILMR